MNERLKQLALQAGSTHKDNLGVYQFFSYELEIFAKMIIQEYERERRAQTLDEDIERNMRTSVPSKISNSKPLTSSLWRRKRGLEKR